MKDENLQQQKRERQKGRRIAVVGVSQDPQKKGHQIFVDLLHSGYEVVGVHPQGGEVEGQALFSSLKEIHPLPEMVITVVPPPVTESIVRQCIELGISHIWMQPGSESPNALQVAQQAGLEVVSSACFMKDQHLW